MFGHFLRKGPSTRPGLRIIMRRHMSAVQVCCFLPILAAVQPKTGGTTCNTDQHLIAVSAGYQSSSSSNKALSQILEVDIM